VVGEGSDDPEGHGVRRILLVAAAVLALLVVAAPAASAHPLGNFTVNRYSGLLLSPGHIQVTYVLDMAEIPTYQESSGIDTNGDGIPVESERLAWAEREAAAILGRITLTAGGSPVRLAVRSSYMTFREGQGNLPTLYFRAVFAGGMPSSGALRFADANYADRIGWAEVTATSVDGVAVAGSTVPSRTISDELTAYPRAALSSPLAVTSASLSFAPGLSNGGGAPPVTSGGTSGSPATSGGAFAALVNWKLTPLVLLLSLGLAFAFGALHALGPGHGKTITAAYLVGKGARMRQAVAAGVAVAFMHTASVLGLGLVALVLFESFPAELVYPWLGLVTGLVAFCLGTAMLVVRVRARRRGLDPWRGQGHAHPHAPVDAPARELALVGAPAAHSRDAGMAARSHAADHRHDDDEHGLDPATERVISRKGIAALAVSGGLLPSPTALVVLTAAAAYHRVGYGLGLIVAFSLGLATALIAVALVALRARAIVSRQLGSKVAGIVPIASAAVIVGFGLFFVARGLAQVA
jgi:nickel/cobalt transporter (NicO) family protein